MITKEGRKRIIAGANKANDIMRRKRREVYALNVNSCLFCGAELPYELRHNKFCNSSCSASYNNSRRVKSSHHCLNCGTETSNNKYCSIRCQAEVTKNFKRQQIEQGLVKTPQTVKAHLIDMRGRRCEICGIVVWNNEPVPLVLDHIDGNSENWKLNNLRLICHNCDALLPTFTGRNRGNGRYYRRQRYAEGKSS